MFLWSRSLFNPPQRKIAGFTLIELLVSMVIATIVVSGLMSFVVQLLSTNQKESAQTQTQNDMQLALNYISADLREAVYVYPGECLRASGLGTATATSVTSDFCPGVVNYIKTPPPNSMPILAFWRLDTLSDYYLSSTQCGSATPPAGVPCISGRTYTLVVYFLRKNLPSETRWSGKARLLRYELPNYKHSDDTTAAGNALIAKYVNPALPGVGFRRWPFKDNTTGGAEKLQDVRPDIGNADAQVLVDFVDDTVRTGDSAATCPYTAPDFYKITPTVTASPFVTDMRSFYACVRVDNVSGDGEAINQDVLVFLRGNTDGRSSNDNSGITSPSSNLPMLKTQVLRRGISNKNPTQVQ